MRFADIPGHDDVKQKLRRLADSDRIPHALLLEGPAGLLNLRLRELLHNMCIALRASTATAAVDARRAVSMRHSIMPTRFILFRW